MSSCVVLFFRSKALCYPKIFGDFSKCKGDPTEDQSLNALYCKCLSFQNYKLLNPPKTVPNVEKTTKETSKDDPTFNGNSKSSGSDDQTSKAEEVELA